MEHCSRALATCLTQPTHRGVVDIHDPFNTTKSPAVDVHLQASLFDVRGIASLFGRLDKLATTLMAAVTLLASMVAVFTDLRGLTSRTLHVYILACLSWIIP